MAELGALDVQTYTKGRLDKDDPETARLLSSALGAARRYCGWRVTPPATETLTLDGPGGCLLVLPTLCLTELVSVTENGVALDMSTLKWSPLGLVRKPFHHGRWSCEYGSIVVKMTHGYATADANDFNAAVLSVVDRMSLTVGMGVGPSANLAEKRTLGVTYRWQEAEVVPLLDDALLAPFRLPIIA